jgi:GNAT superfamily N-acetyltransferase
MSEGLTYRWIDGFAATEAEWDLIDSMLAARGWMALNRNTSRILLAEVGGQIQGFHVFQMIPYCGPLHVSKKYRGTGLAEELADKMQDWLVEVNARGWIAVTESPYAAKLCEARGMERLPSPVYVKVNPGGVEV